MSAHLAEVTNEYAYAGMEDTLAIRAHIKVEAQMREMGAEPNRIQIQRTSLKETTRIRDAIKTHGGAIVDNSQTWWEDVPPAGIDAPRFEHDGCEGCAFVARYCEADIWACPQAGMPTIIFRFSDEPADYASGIHLLDELPERLRQCAESALDDSDADSKRV